MHSSSSATTPASIHNFRMLAPYSLDGRGVIRPGMVYRSGALDLMTPADAHWLARDVGLETILDLRHPDELVHPPHALAGRARALSIFAEGVATKDLIAEMNRLYGASAGPERYLTFLLIGGDRMAQAFATFADAANYPILVHCTAGKDRTGVLIAMLMDVLGASDADIADEYGLSDNAIDDLIRFLHASNVKMEGTDEEIRARLATPPERMAGFIALVRERYGSSEEFFVGQGISPADIARVRSILTDPS